MRHQKALALALSMGLLAAMPSIAQADSAAEFEALMLEGIKLYKKGTKDPGAYALAIDKFEKAKKINNIPDVTYNIARAHQQLGNYDQAFMAYCEYSLTSTANAAKVKNYMNEAKTKLGNPNLQCNAETLKGNAANTNNVATASSSVSTASQFANMDFEELMMEGLAAYKVGAKDPANYTKAIEYFKAARDKDNSVPEVTYNIARSYHLLGDCENALENYTLYASTSKANAKKVNEFITSLSSQCSLKGVLDLKCNPSNAFVSIDDKPNKACTGSHALSKGTHTILITAEGYEPETRKIKIEDINTPVSVEVNMRKFTVQSPDEDGAENTTAETSSSEAESSSRIIQDAEEKPVSTSDIMFWSGVATTGVGTVLLIAGGASMATAFTQVTHSSGNEVHYYYDANAKQYNAGAAVFAVGAVAAAAGIALFIVDKVLFQDQADAQAVRIAPAVSFDTDSASAGFTMTF